MSRPCLWCWFGFLFLFRLPLCARCELRQLRAAVVAFELSAATHQRVLNERLLPKLRRLERAVAERQAVLELVMCRLRDENPQLAFDLRRAIAPRRKQVLS